MGIRSLGFYQYRLWFALLILFMGSKPALAVSQLEDRLNTPSHMYGNILNSLFVDVQRVGNRLLALGERGLIAYSDNYGGSWQQAKVPVSNGLTALHFPDPASAYGWAVGHGGVILHSQDAGETWVKQFDGFQANQLILDIIKQKLLVLKSTFDAADELEQEDLLYDIEDAEYALSDAEFDAEMGPTNPFLDIWFRNEKEGFAVGAYGLFFSTIDGGETWVFVGDRLENIDRYHLNAIQKIKGGALIIAGEAGSLFASYDLGASWQTLYGPYQGSFFGIQSTQNVKEVLIYGLRGNVFRSSDDGQSWQKIDTNISTSIAGSSLGENGDIFLVGFSGTILVSEDDGQSFFLRDRASLEAYNAVAVLNNRSIMIASEKGLKLQ